MNASVSGLSLAAGSPAFATTHWSLVCAAQGESEAARAALEELCRVYWPPVFAFIRRQGHTVDDAQDMTQGFFARLLERRDFEAVKREKGRLRSYLLAAVKNFLVNEHHRAHSIKRGGLEIIVSLDQLTAQEYNEPSSDALTADCAYERRWALTVLEQVLAELGAAYERAGNGELFRCFKALLAADSDELSHAKIGEELGMTENAVKQAYLRFRRSYRETLRATIAQTVAVSTEVEDELRHLITALRA